MPLTTSKEILRAADALEHLTHDGCSSAETATVSRQEQDVIERHNFERITVTICRMPEFKTMTRHNLTNFACVRLKLEREEDMSEDQSENKLVRRVEDIRILIKIISDLRGVLRILKPDAKLRLEADICSSGTSHELLWGAATKPTSALANQSLL